MSTNVDAEGFPLNMIDLSKGLPCECQPCREQHKRCHPKENNEPGYCEYFRKDGVICLDHQCFTYLDQHKGTDECGLCGHKKGDHVFTKRVKNF